MLQNRYNNTIGSIKVLVESAKEIGTYDIVKAKKQSEQILEVDDDAVIDGKLGALIKTVWTDPGIQATYVTLCHGL